MAVLNILTFPNPRLRMIARPVEQVNESVRQLIDDMFETMYAAEGIGLAATQVDVHSQIIVMDISAEQDEPLVFINPEITVLAETRCDFDEGCLSVPGYFSAVSRPDNIEVKALDRNGEPFSLKPDGLLAVCIQHEMDHLNGKLFVDYISALKRRRIGDQIKGITMTPQQIKALRQEQRAAYRQQAAANSN